MKFLMVLDNKQIHIITYYSINIKIKYRLTTLLLIKILKSKILNLKEKEILNVNIILQHL